MRPRLFSLNESEHSERKDYYPRRRLLSHAMSGQEKLDLSFKMIIIINITKSVDAVRTASFGLKKSRFHFTIKALLLLCFSMTGLYKA